MNKLISNKLFKNILKKWNFKQYVEQIRHMSVRNTLHHEEVNI